MLDEILEITAWFTQHEQEDAALVQDLQRLVGQLAALSPVFERLISKNDPDDPGVDLLDPGLPQRFADWYTGHRAAFPKDEDLKLVVGAKPFLAPDGEEISSYSLIFFWGIAGNLDRLKIKMPMRFAENPDMVALVTGIVTALTDWRDCRLVTAAPSVLKMHGKLFPESHSAGFGIWLTSDLRGIDLSDAHGVFSLNGGHLVLTASEMFNLANAEAVARLHRVDGHLMQSGALPELGDFLHPI